LEKDEPVNPLNFLLDSIAKFWLLLLIC